MTGTIRTGIGGWTFEPWRGTFYPADLPKAKELDFAAQHLRTIEINGTFYRTQSPATFAKWRDAAPAGFVYAVKALQYCVAKKKLAEAGESIGRFLASGLTSLARHWGRSSGSSARRGNSMTRTLPPFSTCCPGRSTV